MKEEEDKELMPYFTRFAMFLITGDASPSNIHLNSHWRYLPGNEKNDEPKFVILDYIKHILPKAKIIIVFRDPIERFVYCPEFEFLMQGIRGN